MIWRFMESSNGRRKTSSAIGMKLTVSHRLPRLTWIYNERVAAGTRALRLEVGKMKQTSNATEDSPPERAAGRTGE
jgi:hypothetical protein